MEVLSGDAGVWPLLEPGVKQRGSIRAANNRYIIKLWRVCHALCTRSSGACIAVHYTALVKPQLPYGSATDLEAINVQGIWACPNSHFAAAANFDPLTKKTITDAVAVHSPQGTSKGQE